MASTVTAPSTMNVPKTPISSAKTVTATATPSPGNWKHPRMAEIARRRKASVFDSSNVLRVVSNIAALLGTFAAAPVLQSYLPVVLSTLYRLTYFLGAYQSFPLYVLRIIFVFNLYQAFQPLWRTPDTLSDIPLTPSQRRLLGLDPGSGRPNTPKTEFVTPPKYKRSTPRSSSPAWGQGNPVGGSGIPQRGQGVGREGVSPSSGSPLYTAWRELPRDLTMERSSNSDANRQSGLGFDPAGSLGFSSSRDSLRESSSTWVPSSPSPNNRTTSASVGLNSKWLYERGRSSSGSRRSFGGL